MTTKTTLLAALAALILVAGCGGDGESDSETASDNDDAAPTTEAEPTTETLEGTLVITGEDAWLNDKFNQAPGYQCQGTRGYNDIVQGTQVTVTVDGDTVGIADLSVGESTEAGCEFTFEVPDVPTGEDFYAIAAGNSSRGSLELSGADLERDDWTVELTL